MNVTFVELPRPELIVVSLPPAQINVEASGPAAISLVSLPPAKIDAVAMGVGLQGVPGIPGSDGVYGRTVTAGEPLGGHRCVLVDAAGLAYYADNTDISHFGRVEGITHGACPAGSSVPVTRTGLLMEPSWAWVTGLPVFLGRSGLLTQTQQSVGFQQVLGVALSAVTIFVNPREPIFTVN